MSKTSKKKAESTTSEETTESYPIYTNSGTINVTISGNNNVVTFMAGQPTPPPKPPGGGH